MLHDGSDSEDSFTDEAEGEEGERARHHEGERERDGEKSDTILPSAPPSASISASGGSEGAGKVGGATEGEKESGVSEEEKGDPEMAPVYLKKMLPVFAELFHSSLTPTLRSPNLPLSLTH